jgi:hypothetical protein
VGGGEERWAGDFGNWGKKEYAKFRSGSPAATPPPHRQCGPHPCVFYGLDVQGLTGLANLRKTKFWIAPHREPPLLTNLFIKISSIG